ncbi:MAG: hypothetical protein JWN37_223 [Candidatus Nomurabacteria bacterium]|nr:hypothetical protein [Candidatus Nomurabacteria bacterium]
MDEQKKVIVRGICINEGNILLIHVPASNGKAEHFVLPGGRASEDESIEAALTREFEKDTCVNVSIRDLFLSSDDISEGEGVEDDCYICDYKFGAPAKRDDTSPYTPVWIPLAHMKQINLYPEKIKELILKDIS